MAKKINFIKLIELNKDGEATVDKNGDFKVETFFTPTFVPFRKVYEATEMLEEAEQGESTEESFQQMLEFVANIYNNQFTKDDLLDRLHAPDAISEIQSQIEFIARGAMDDERKKQLAKMI